MIQKSMVILEEARSKSLNPWVIWGKVFHLSNLLYRKQLLKEKSVPIGMGISISCVIVNLGNITLY